MVKSKFRWLGPIVVGTVLGLLTGCGGVDLLSIHDGRLPIEARRWVADAEDAVSVANAFLQEAEAAQRRTKKLAQEMSGQADEIRNAGGGQAADKLDLLAKTRLGHADLLVMHARSELALSLTKQLLVNAETSMRHDIAVYELEPLRAAVAEGQTVATVARRKAVSAGLTVHKRSGEYWQIYAGWVRGGGDIKAYWLLQGEPVVKSHPFKKKAKPTPKATPAAPKAIPAP